MEKVINPEVPWEVFPAQTSYTKNVTENQPNNLRILYGEVLKYTSDIAQNAKITTELSKEEFQAQIENARLIYQNKVRVYSGLQKAKSKGINSLTMATAKIEMDQAYSNLNEWEKRFSELYPKEKQPVISPVNTNINYKTPVVEPTTKPFVKYTFIAGGIGIVAILILLLFPNILKSLNS